MAAELPPLDDPEAVDPELRQRVAHRSTIVSVVVNIVLTVAQLAAGLWAHSQALVADAIHSLSDLLSDFLVLLVNHRAFAAIDRRQLEGKTVIDTRGVWQ